MNRQRTPHGKFTTETFETARASLASKLDLVAERILDTVLADKQMSLDQQIDVLKVVGAYHLGLTRVSGKRAEDEDSGSSFRDWSARLRQEKPDA